MTKKEITNICHIVHSTILSFFEPFEEEEGFWTSNGRFVDRYEAKEIAVAANQLIVPIEETYDALYSEDVW